MQPFCCAFLVSGYASENLDYKPTGTSQHQRGAGVAKLQAPCGGNGTDTIAISVTPAYKAASVEGKPNSVKLPIARSQ